MRNRWLIYIVAGLGFGVVEWMLMEILSVPSKSPVLSDWIVKAPLALQIGLGLLLAFIIYGAWFVAAVPVITREMRQSRSVVITTVAVVVLWCAAIVGYYGFYAFLLLFVGLPHMDFMIVARIQSAAEWADWWPTFRHVIVNQVLENVVVVMVVGAVAGPIMALIIRHYSDKHSRAVAVA